MVNFEKLVESVLLLEATIKNLASTPPFISGYNKITSIYPAAGSIPTEDAFYNTVQNSIFTRSSSYVLAEEDVAPHYAFIDYLCFMNENRKDKSKNIALATSNFNDDSLYSGTSFITLTQDWQNHLSGDGSRSARAKPAPADRHPILDYTPKSQTLLGLRPKLIEILMAKGVLGKMAMKNYISNNYNLAEAINSAITLSQTNIPLINRKQEDKNINDVLLNPNQYTIGSSGGSSSLMSRVASAITSPKQLPEKAKTFKESIFAIAQAIPTYASAKSPTTTSEDIIKKSVKDIQTDATSITEAKLIIQQLEAMSNHLPGKKDLAGKITGVVSGLGQIAKGLQVAPTMGR